MAQAPPLSRPALVVTKGGAAAAEIAVSPDGKWFVTGHDGAVTIWSAEDGREYRTFNPLSAGELQYRGSITVASDAATIVLSQHDGTVHLFDVNSTRELRHFRLDDSGDAQIEASPREMVLAAIGAGGGAQVVSLADGQVRFHAQLPVVRKFIYESAPPRAHFSPDGSLLAVLTEEVFELWDWAGERKLLSLDAHAFHSPNLSRAVTWQDGKVTRQSTAEERHYFYLVDACFAPDGRTTALVSRDELTVLALPSGKKLASTQIDGVLRACMFIDNDHVMAARGDGDTTVFTVSTRTATAVQGLGLEDYKPLPRSHRGALLAVGGAAALVDGQTFEVVRIIESQAQPPFSLQFSAGGKDLFWGSWSKPLTAWSLGSGEAVAVPGERNTGTGVISGDGKYLAVNDDLFGGRIRIFNLRAGREEGSLPFKFTTNVASLSLSADGTMLVASQETGEVHIFSVREQREIASLSADHPTQAAMAPDGRRFAVADRSGTTVYAFAPSPRKLALLGPSEYGLQFSPDGKWLVLRGSSGVQMVSTETWKVVRSLGFLGGLCIAFSLDSRQIAFEEQLHGARIEDAASGQTVFQDATRLTGCPLAFSPDGRVLAAATEFGAALFSTDTGDLLASLYLYGGEKDRDWIVVTPEGLFDGTPAAWSYLRWRFSDNTFDVAPVELFFREFYHPGLLADILAGKHPRATTDIASIDRRQPAVRLSLSGSGAAEAPIAERRVKVAVEVHETPADAQHPAGSGAQDVRLFRNGSLVHIWHGDVLKGKEQAKLEAEVTLVAGENRLTAYAFNHDNIKSSDASLTVTGADSLKRQGTAYILAVGINQYASSDFNLRYAAADAQDFAQEIEQQQKKLGRYAKVEVTSLQDRQATKANLLAALQHLAEVAQPEDAVFIYYAGHGTAAGARFYLIPHDLGYAGTRNDLDEAAVKAVLAHSVSDLDLDQAFESIDAGEMVLVIDACRSGQALQADDPRQGPMNSKGLAQLAYEKGMYILTASQGYQAALEASSYGHGLLTYALVEEGLKSAKADDEPQDGQVTLREWLDYASGEVPQLELQLMQAAEKRGAELSIVEGEQKVEEVERRSLQRPRVFYRREPEAQPFVVAKP